MNPKEAQTWIDRFVSAAEVAPITRVHFSVGMTLLLYLGSPTKTGRSGQPVSDLSIFLGYEWFLTAANSQERRSSRELAREAVNEAIAGTKVVRLAHVGHGDIAVELSSGDTIETGDVNDSPGEYESDWTIWNEDDPLGLVTLEPDDLLS